MGEALRAIGIDFSGDVTRWRARCGRPNVWVAQLVDGAGERPALVDVRPVQALPGAEPEPYDRLARWLATSDFSACAIDAPLSVPADVMPADGFAGLVALVDALASARPPFGRGAEVVAALLGEDALPGVKRFRGCEQIWRARGLNLRSALWAGPRGGAPLLAASLPLVARSGREVWPQSAADGASGVLVEGYPAGQLAAWGLPHQRYGRADAAAASLRQAIVAALSERVTLGAHAATLEGSADALDAALCAVGALALAKATLAAELPDDAPRSEGWVAVAR